VVGRRGLLLAVALLCYLAAVIAARPHSTPGPFVRDFEAYWSAGRVADAGNDAYSRDVWRAERTVPGVDGSRDELLPFVGPPYGLWIWRVFGRFEYPVAAHVWWVLLAISIAGLGVAALAGTGLTPRAPPAIAAILFAFSFGPITSGLALGQVTSIAMMGACCATLWTRDGRIAKVTVATLFAALQPNIAFGTLAALRRPVTAVAIAGAAILAYLLGAAATGWSWPFAYAHLLAAHAGAERFATIQFAPSAILYGAGMAPPAAIAGGIVITVVGLILAVIAFWRIRDTYARFACLSALVPFVAGFAHEHDLIVAFPAAVLTAARSRGTTRAVAAFATLLVAVDWLGLAQRPTGIVQSALLAIATGCLFAAFGPKSVSELVATPVFCALFAAAAWLAIQHPIAVWPDALGTFHATGSGVASVWHAELERNRLFSVNPAAALLRALSLAGCALLAAAVYREALVVDVHHVVERRPRIGLESG
jgi:hypothetical protein